VKISPAIPQSGDLALERAAGKGASDAVPARPLLEGVGDAAREAQTVEGRLFTEGYAFEFFQAVRLLHQLNPSTRLVGRDAPPSEEAVRFRAHLSLAFPPSQIYELQRPAPGLHLPLMTVSIMHQSEPSA